MTLLLSTALRRNFFTSEFSKNIVFRQEMAFVQCDMRFLKIDLEIKSLHIIERHGRLLFFTSYILNIPSNLYQPLTYVSKSPL